MASASGRCRPAGGGDGDLAAEGFADDARHAAISSSAWKVTDAEMIERGTLVKDAAGRRDRVAGEEQGLPPLGRGDEAPGSRPLPVILR